MKHPGDVPVTPRVSLHDTDLVKLGEAERLLGLKKNRLEAVKQRTDLGAVTGMPGPVITGRSVRLWSLAELREWWAERETSGDGRTLRHTR